MAHHAIFITHFIISFVYLITYSTMCIPRYNTYVCITTYVTVKNNLTCRPSSVIHCANQNAAVLCTCTVCNFNTSQKAKHNLIHNHWHSRTFWHSGILSIPASFLQHNFTSCNNLATAPQQPFSYRIKKKY